MSKRKYGIFTVAESMPNWFAASQQTKVHPDNTNVVLEQGTISSPKTSAPTQEGPIISAAVVASCPHVEWAESQPNGPNIAIQTEGSEYSNEVNSERSGLGSLATAEVDVADVALTTAQVATEEEVSIEDVVASQEAASEWFWTLLSQSGYERW